MAEDWKQIALDATKQCQAYEEEIKHLEDSLMLKKQASFADPVLLKESVDALVKVGSITQDQADESMRLLSSDPNASLRVIKALCGTDAKPLTKTESVNLEGGTLVGEKAAPLTDREQAYAAVARQMGIALN